MIVCQCTGVTDTTIHRLIGQGVSTVEEIARRTGAGSCCPPCRAEIASMLYRPGHTQDNGAAPGRDCEQKGAERPAP